MKATFDLTREQLEQGKWYKSNEFSVRSIFRFDESRSIEDKFYYSEYFNEDQATFEYTKKVDFFYIHDNSLFAEVTQEEIDEKFSIAKEEEDWKKGDYFKVLTDKPNCSEFNIDKIYRVKEACSYANVLFGEEISGQEMLRSAVSVNNIRRLNAEETKELEDELKRRNITSSTGPSTNNLSKKKHFDSYGNQLVNGDWCSFIWNYSNDKRLRYAKFDESRSSNEFFISNGSIWPDFPSSFRKEDGYDFSLMEGLKRVYKGIKEIQIALPFGHEDIIHDILDSTGDEGQRSIVMKNKDNIHKNITVPKIESEKTITVEKIENIKI